MSVQQKPILHGRDHAEGGADPIPGLGTGGGGGIDFDVWPQQGDYFHLETLAGSVPGQTAGIQITSQIDTSAMYQPGLLSSRRGGRAASLCTGAEHGTAAKLRAVSGTLRVDLGVIRPSVLARVCRQTLSRSSRPRISRNTPK